MSYIEKSKVKKKIIYNKFTAIILSVIVLVLGASVISVFGKYKEAGDKIDISKAQFLELQEREAYLKSELDKLSTQEGKEEAIRNKYRAVKEGEGVVVIVDENKNRTSLDDGNFSKEKIGFFETIKNWFR